MESRRTHSHKKDIKILRNTKANIKKKIGFEFAQRYQENIQHVVLVTTRNGRLWVHPESLKR